MTMKHKFFALSVLALSLSLTSCLDETPKDQLPEQNIYDSANSLYVNAVASLYNYTVHTRRAKACRAHAAAYTTTTH